MNTKPANPFGGIARALSIGAITSAICLSNAGAEPPHHNYNMTMRAARQKSHAQQGVKSGELTKAQAEQIKSHEENVKGQMEIDRAADGGKMTTAERRQALHAQNRIARKIYDLKHDQANPQP